MTYDRGRSYPLPLPMEGFASGKRIITRIHEFVFTGRQSGHIVLIGKRRRTKITKEKYTG